MIGWEKMKIADGIEMLEVEITMMGNKRIQNHALLYDDQHVVLVDVGMPGQLEPLKAAVEKAGFAFSDIDTVIFTHQDIDHIGCIQDVLQAVGKPVAVCAHAEERPYIEGEKEPIKMTRERVNKMLDSVPAEMRKEVEAIYLSRPSAKITNTVADREVLPIAGGIHVIHTPGHTPGHICLYHEPSKTLVTGDATVSEDGKLLGPNPAFTPDLALARASLKKLTAFDIANAICCHGGLCSDQVNEQIRGLTI